MERGGSVRRGRGSSPVLVVVDWRPFLVRVWRWMVVMETSLLLTRLQSNQRNRKVGGRREDGEMTSCFYAGGGSGQESQQVLAAVSVDCQKQ